MRRNHVIFPISVIEETIRILQSKGATFRRAADFHPAGARLRTRTQYRREYVASSTGSASRVRYALWLAGWVWRQKLGPHLGLLRPGSPPRPRPGHPEVFLQHDADRNPDHTVAVMELEKRLGVVSSSYFFRERARRDPADIEPYDLDVPALQALEASGFEVGYHLNGPELENYDPERANLRVRDDVAWFRERFRLRSFVPHGGRVGPRGEENHLWPPDPSLDDLVWFYCGRGIAADVIWTDGSLEDPSSRSLEDPREVARRVAGRQRVRFLFHPQYYGPELRGNLSGVGVVETAWWRSLWAA